MEHRRLQAQAVSDESGSAHPGDGERLLSGGGASSTAVGTRDPFYRDGSEEAGRLLAVPSSSARGGESFEVETWGTPSKRRGDPLWCAYLPIHPPPDPRPSPPLSPCLRICTDLPSPIP